MVPWKPGFGGGAVGTSAGHRYCKDLMAGGWKPGPALGEELRRLRLQRLEQLR